MEEQLARRNALGRSIRKNWKSFLPAGALLGVALTALLVSALVSISLSGCAPESPKLVPPPEGKPERVRDVSETKVSFQRSVDILFVVDDSGSMESHQQNLATNIGLFTRGMKTNQILDYHIGVLTSNMDSAPWRSAPGYGWKGELNGTTKFVTKTTPNGDQILAKNLNPGINGSGSEMFFSPVEAALTAPLIGGVNNGFYRPDAHLAIVFLTDADDQSRLSATDFYKFLLNLKRGDPDKIITYGVYIPSNAGNCARSGEPTPDKLEEFFKLSKATTLGLCDVDYGVKLAALGADLVRKIGSVLYLSRPAVPQSIRVKFGSQTIPNHQELGWIYDPSRNALLFGDGIDLKPEPPGTQIEVEFLAAQY
jgi:hypothetical protein